MSLYQLLYGTLYLGLSVWFGFTITRFLRPQLQNLVAHHYKESAAGPGGIAPLWTLTIALALLFGLVLPPTITYVISIVLKSVVPTPFWWANVLTMTGLGIFCGTGLLAQRSHRSSALQSHDADLENHQDSTTNRAPRIHAYAFAVLWLLISYYLTAGHLSENAGTVNLGFSIFYDMLFHIAQVQSFAFGENIPAQNVYFAGAPNRYHFMLDFLSGNLAFLGWKLTLAINIPGLLAIYALGLLIYTAGVLMAGHAYGGWLAILLFVFRSSMALLFKIRELRQMEWTMLLDYLRTDFNWVGTTPFESWALWTLNPFTNQHHFGLGLAIVVLVFLWHLPHLSSTTSSAKGAPRSFDSWWRDELREFPRGTRLLAVLAMATLTGLSALFNGATLLAALLILGAVLILGTKRAETMLYLLVALVCALLERHYLAGGAGGESSYVHIGFLSPSSRPEVIVEYYLRTFGILLPLVVIYFFLLSAAWRRMALVALLPLVFATFYVVAGEVARNHKLVSSSIVLFNILLALPLVRLLRSSNFSKVIAAILLFFLTFTGFYDLRTLVVSSLNVAQVSLHQPGIEWIKRETAPDAVFVTAPSAQSQDDLAPLPVLAGRKVYIGYREFLQFTDLPYRHRDRLVKLMYTGALGDQLPVALQREKIDYVVLDEQALAAGVAGSAKQAFDSYLAVAMQDGVVTIYKPRRNED